MRWYLDGLRRYATFRGRTSREAFWQYQAVAFVGLLVAGGLAFSLPWLGGLLCNVFLGATLLPALAICVRRLHDTGRRAAWLGVVLALDLGQYGGWLAVIASQGESLAAWTLALVLTIGAYAGSLLLFGLLCQPGTPGPNRYGLRAPTEPGG